MNTNSLVYHESSKTRLVLPQYSHTHVTRAIYYVADFEEFRITKIASRICIFSRFEELQDSELSRVLFSLSTLSDGLD